MEQPQAINHKQRKLTIQKQLEQLHLQMVIIEFLLLYLVIE
jgi:hypothetical protein